MVNQIWIFRICKNMGVGCLQAEIKIKKKCKIEPLEVSGHWFRVLRKTTCPRVFFLALGRMTYSHFPKPDLHLALKTKPYDFPF